MSSEVKDIKMVFLRDGQSFRSDMKVEMVRIVVSANESSERSVIINFQESCNVIMIKVDNHEDINEICREVSDDINRGLNTKLSEPKSILKSPTISLLPSINDLSKKVGFSVDE